MNFYFGFTKRPLFISNKNQYFISDTLHSWIAVPINKYLPPQVFKNIYLTTYVHLYKTKGRYIHYSIVQSNKFNQLRSISHFSILDSSILLFDWCIFSSFLVDLGKLIQWLHCEQNYFIKFSWLKKKIKTYYLHKKVMLASLLFVILNSSSSFKYVGWWFKIMSGLDIFSFNFKFRYVFSLFYKVKLWGLPCMRMDGHIETQKFHLVIEIC